MKHFALYDPEIARRVTETAQASLLTAIMYLDIEADGISEVEVFRVTSSEELQFTTMLLACGRKE